MELPVKHDRMATGSEIVDSVPNPLTLEVHRRDRETGLAVGRR